MVHRVSNEDWIEAFKAPGTLREIGARVGSSKTAAQKAKIRLGLEHTPHPSSPPPGTKPAIVWNYSGKGPRKAAQPVAAAPRPRIRRGRITAEERAAIEAATPPVSERATVAVKVRSMILPDKTQPVTLRAAPWSERGAW